MVKFLFGVIGALLVSTSTYSLAKQANDTIITTRKQMASKMIYKSLADRDSSYGMAKYYAECSGMYDAIADKYDEDYKGNATSIEFRDKSNSVNVIANFYWQIYSNSHKLDIKGIGEELDMDITVTPEGQVIAAGQTLGELKGLVFTPVTADNDLEAKAVDQAAKKALSPEIDRRLTALAGSQQGSIALSDQGEFLWNDAAVGKLVMGDSMLKPKVELLCGELGSQVLQGVALGRLSDYIRLEIEQKLGCIFALRDFSKSPTSFKDARALAHVMFENNGTLDGRLHHKLIREAESTARGHIVGLGGAFGFYYAYMRDLMKPAPARLLSILYVFAWAGKQGGTPPSQPFFLQMGLRHCRQ